MWFSKNLKGMRKGNNKCLESQYPQIQYNDLHVFIPGKMLKQTFPSPSLHPSKKKKKDLRHP